MAQEASRPAALEAERPWRRRRDAPWRSGARGLAAAPRSAGRFLCMVHRGPVPSAQSRAGAQRASGEGGGFGEPLGCGTGAGARENASYAAARPSGESTTWSKPQQLVDGSCRMNWQSNRPTRAGRFPTFSIHLQRARPSPPPVLGHPGSDQAGGPSAGTCNPGVRHAPRRHACCRAGQPRQDANRTITRPGTRLQETDLAKCRITSPAGVSNKGGLVGF